MCNKQNEFSSFSLNKFINKSILQNKDFFTYTTIVKRRKMFEFNVNHITFKFNIIHSVMKLVDDVVIVEITCEGIYIEIIYV